MTGARRPLRLLAEDTDDLEVLSAALQDAVTTAGEVVYDPSARTLTLAVDRFCWECAEPIRIRAGLQLGGVLRFQARGVRPEPKAAVLHLLALAFEPSAEPENPGGTLLIHLAGGGDLRAEVECVDVVLADLSDPWPARSAPAHDLEA